jgi:hypothetical protein
MGRKRRRIYIRPKSIGTNTGLGIIGKPMTEDQLNVIPIVPPPLQYNIPDKCRRHPDEEQMHIAYIENEVWTTRDRLGCEAIREMYLDDDDIGGVIYKFTNLSNNYSYIGQARNMSNRLKGHLCKKSLNHGGADLQRAIRKHGIDYFTCELLLTAIEEPRLYTEEGRLYFEALYVEKFDSFYNGYNTQRTTTDPIEREAIIKALREPLVAGGRHQSLVAGSLTEGSQRSVMMRHYYNSLAFPCL